ncbi:radical SAM protein [bacterium]|jgi:MoaA/NifB/PqqE/SkfB family radical SAM enzyme|nr:radical SAM protein [bacterium]
MPNLQAYKNSEIICPEGPYTLFIEPTNHCNLACVFCPQKSQERDLGFMSMEVFDSILEDARNNDVRKINIFFLGESLMHKRLFEMIGKIRVSGLESRLNTNATFLDESRAKQLLESGLDFLTISFEGTDKKTYESLRVKANYETTMANIRRLLEMRQGSGFTTSINIEIIDMEETHAGLDNFEKEMWKLSPDEVSRKVYRNWIGYLSAQKNLSLQDAYNVCSYPWRSMAALWDGTYVPCCVDYDGKYPLGTFKEGLINVWNGQRMRDLRRYLIDRKTDLHKNHGQRECHGLCSRCDIPFDPEDHRV